MPKKTDGETMHERILHSALEVFSDKGYSAATIRDISNRAGCNTVTIFRHFEDKMGLFLQVVERYHKFEFDAEALNLKLSYINQIYKHIHILRIFINDGHNFEPISKYLWFIPEEMKRFVEDYLQSMYPERISVSDLGMLSEMFLCYIIRTCLRINVHDRIEENSRQIAQEAKAVMSKSVDMMVELILLQVREPAIGQ